MKKYTLKEIEKVFRKLKSYSYYDNFFLYLRERLASFETNENFESRLKDLVDFLNLNNEIEKSDYFNGLLSNIDFVVIPKKFKHDKIEDPEDFIITNKFSSNHYEVESCNYLIDAPIEIHLISLLWILNEGVNLNDTYKKNNYAYALELDDSKSKVVNGLRLFKPYFEQYQKWRDSAINKAQNFIEEGTDILMISVDVKQYFYNINLTEKLPNFKKDLRKGSTKKGLPMTNMLLKIHEAYQLKLKGNIPSNINYDNCIPIGLLSSGIIGNWFLKDLDLKITDNLSPVYYGRYVDDIIIVLSNASVNENEPKPKSAILKKFFVDRDILKNEEENINVYSYSEDENIKLQKDKTTVYAFDSKESHAVLEKFKKNIEKNSSAFWFLPDEENADEDFDDNVYELTYSDTTNKLRSISEIKQSKYGASIYLAKKIKLALLSDDKKDLKTTKQILTFFKGRINLEFNSIWEKALTYFIIQNNTKAFIAFINETHNSIKKIKVTELDKSCSIDKLQQGQYSYLLNSIALSLCINPKFLNKDIESHIERLENKILTIESLNQIILNYKKTNLFRHYFVIQPLLNFSIFNLETNLLKFDIQNYKDIKLLNEKFKYAPRYIYLHEIVHYLSFQKLYNSSQNINEVNNTVLIEDLFLKEVNYKDENENTINYSSNKVLDDALKLYYKFNYELRNSGVFNQLEFDSIKSAYFKNTRKKNHADTIKYDEVSCSNKQQKDTVRIAIANMIVKEENIKASLFYKPILSTERRKNFIDILNQAENCKTEFLVLPEVSIPYQWLPLIADESRRKQRVIIGGLEHIRINNVCYNIMVTCLPVERNGIKDVITVFRLKNHYSPHESKSIRNQNKIVPIPSPYTYNKFIWKNIHFSVYNCYELADITHRSVFRSEVDLLFASEYNRDINYFSNITETISRDVHCYFVQVNSSDFGDSRITKPSRTEIKDIIRLKGGINSVVLYDEINLTELREFQKTHIDGQKTIKFKNTPPNYKHSKAEDRINQKF